MLVSVVSCGFVDRYLAQSSKFRETAGEIWLFVTR